MEPTEILEPHEHGDAVGIDLDKVVTLLLLISTAVIAAVSISLAIEHFRRPKAVSVGWMSSNVTVEAKPEEKEE